MILPADVPVSPAVALGLTTARLSWLRVRKVADPAPLVPPAALAGWLSGVAIGTTLPPPLPVDLDERCERTGDDPATVRAAHAEWAARGWRPWAESARVIMAARALYQQLYDLRLRLARDGATHELVWGHGVLSWRVGGQLVEHPLLMTRMTIEMDSDDGELTVVADGFPALETEPLDALGAAARAELTRLRNELRADPPDPWADGSLAQVYAQLVAPFGLDATVLPGDEVPAPTARPVLVDTWVLFVRPRPTLYPRFYAELRDVLAERGIMPDAFATLVDEDGSRAYAAASGGAGSASPLGGRVGLGGRVVGELLGERLLFPLASNDEQERIAVQLNQASGVTVQGPPGTGKSHTIANLVSHLVAHGQRVLVTAHNEQALAVLREKVPAELRDLSIAVLGASSTALTQLHASIQMILESVAGIDVTAERAALVGLVRQLDDARLRQRRLELALRQLLADEAAEFTLPDGPAKAAQVAEWLAHHEPRWARIPDQLAAQQTPPLSVADLDELMRLAADLAVDAAALRHTLPAPASLPTTAELGAQLRQLDELRDDLADLGTRGLDLAGVDEAGPAALVALGADVRAAAQRVGALEEPWLGRIRDQVAQSQAFATWWDELVRTLAGTQAEILDLRRVTLGRDVIVPDGDHRIQNELLTELATRFAAGRGLPRLGARDLRAFHGAVRVDGLELRCVDDVEVVRAKLAERVRTAAASRQYQTLVDQVGAPALPGEASVFVPLLAERLSQLHDALRWELVDGPALLARLHRLVARFPSRPSGAQLTEVAGVVSAAARRESERQLTAWLAQLDAHLRAGRHQTAASPLWETLAEACERRDLAAWAAARDEVVRLTALRPGLDRRDALAGRLATQAPLWAARIIASEADPAVCGEAVDLAWLWSWAQAQTWLSALHARGDVAPLQSRLGETGEQVHALVLEIAARSARLGMKLNLAEEQRRALMGWLQSLQRIGKGTGKYAARWEAEARRDMPTAMGAVPVWIMPIHRVLQSFDPRRTDLFDVVIVDESSQCDVLSLGVLALGRKIVVVGDDRQISPAAVGANREQIFRLIDAYLPGFGQRSLLDLEASLYDTATRVFPDVVLLREHFRCVPDIIEFSNRFYDGRILPLREQRDLGIGAPVRPVRVPGGARADGQYGNVNEPEAVALVDQLVACCQDPAYDELTFGVVTLLGGGQGRLIEQKLLEKLGSEEFERRRLRVGDAYNFQGDERDVIFLSVVADSATYAATRKPDQQRVNVAASRARDQLWIYHTVDPGTLHPDDVRGQLLSYAYGVNSPQVRAGSLAAQCDSDFERRVLRELLIRGYRVRPQHQVGHFRIDLVVEGAADRLAVECDGDRFHGPDQWDADLRRQRVLERQGWRFWRVRGSAFYRQPQAALASLWETLDELGIRPTEPVPAQVRAGEQDVHRTRSAPG
ncbi:AAA domain-containing protein [Frankia sp. R82]|uniref:AAA domain-containing protein n=1 Tax=Frankia sp. R82 TaxID=2950553 RepID=UPI00204489D6|nr:AAA domain-containing protein [Frankia sp. R82]MCM3885263.1 AAA domain-containing protein [Frankia sp. R82]